MGTLYIGAHVSASGGVHRAIANAEAIGANALQIFGTSPRQWHVKDVNPQEVERFRAEMKRSDMGPVFFHAPYLINLASPDTSLRRMSRKLLEDNLRNAEILGEVSGVIFHVGSRRDLTVAEGITLAVEALKEILTRVPGRCALVLENSAGGGNTVGVTIEEIGRIIQGVDSERMGFCYDTAHGFASGMVTEYTAESVETLAKSIEKMVGKEKMIAIHLNDSKTPALSRVDRHENIGEGCIGSLGIAAFVNNAFFQRVPWFLEVPGFEGAGPDKKNIDRVKKMITKKHL